MTLFNIYQHEQGMHLFLARILVISFGFLMALSSILMTDPHFNCRK